MRIRRSSAMRPLNENRPEPPQRPLECPESYGEEEANIWHQVLVESAPGVIRPADRGILRAYVRWTMIRNRAERELNRMANDSQLAREGGRRQVKNPLLSIFNTATRQIRSFRRELLLDRKPRRKAILKQFKWLQ